jgi:hypothetical protein
MTTPMRERMPGEPDQQSKSKVKQGGKEKTAKHAYPFADVFRSRLFRCFLDGTGFPGFRYGRLGAFDAHAGSSDLSSPAGESNSTPVKPQSNIFGSKSKLHSPGLRFDAEGGRAPDVCVNLSEFLRNLQWSVVAVTP